MFVIPGLTRDPENMDKKELTEEGKKIFTESKIPVILHFDNHKAQLVFFLYQTITVISGIAMAFAIASKNNYYSITKFISICVFLIVMCLSVFIFLYRGRRYVKYLSEKISEASSREI